MFLPLAFLLTEVVEPGGPRTASARVLVLLAGMLLVITPWSLRNGEVLGATVPIATNGGDVLYRANNPLAVPGYLAEGPVDLRQYPEVERSRLGFRLAIDWIAQEPHRFLVLSWKRLLHFSGDNSTSVYDAFRRNAAEVQSRYVALKAVSNAAWLALWLLILVALANRSLQSAAAPGAWLLVLSYLYLAAMDSIAESGARHHVPFAGVLAVLAASVLCRPRAAATREATSGARHPAAQFLDFAVVGAVGTAAHFATLILLVQSAGWMPAVATTAGFLVGALVNYGLNYHLTFQSQARHAVAMPRFLAIAALSMLLNVAIVWVLVHWNSVHYLLGQVVATSVVLVVNFVANRALTFAAPQPG
jgi:putative flippase GtrA